MPQVIRQSEQSAQNHDQIKPKQPNATTQNIGQKEIREKSHRQPHIEKAGDSDKNNKNHLVKHFRTLKLPVLHVPQNIGDADDDEQVNSSINVCINQTSIDENAGEKTTFISC